MKQASTALTNLLTTGQFMYAALFQISLVNGGNLYYTSHENDILWNGNTYSAGGITGPYFDQEGNKAKMTQSIGLSAQQFQVTVMPGAATINGQSFLSAVRQGVFDGAEITWSGAYWAQGTNENPLVPVAPVGVVPKMVTRIAEGDVARSCFVFTGNDHLELLNQNMPRNLYQSGCNNTLYDSGCTLNKALYGINGSVSAGSSATQINAILSQATGYFDLGLITFTSGILNGVSRSVRAYIQGSPSTFSLIPPFPIAPATGDTFTIYPGCDRTRPTCQGKFNNLTNFRGFPFIPDPSTAI